MKLHFYVNGEAVETEIKPETTLLETLRQLGCHSVRSGCDTSNCGVCTVWVEGKPVLSCSYPAARAEGRRVTTVEGVKEEAEELVKALAKEGAEQCGFCSPGFIMTALAMLKEYPDPDEETMKAYLAGNLCRCSGYMSQMRALKAVTGGRRNG